MRDRWTRKLIEERGAAWVVRHRAWLDLQWRWIQGDVPELPSPRVPRR
jgi:hypothetical protein